MNIKSIISVLALLKNEFLNPNYDRAVTTTINSRDIVITDPSNIEQGMTVWCGTEGQWGKVEKVLGNVLSLTVTSKATGSNTFSFGFGLETAMKAACAEAGLPVSAMKKWSYLDTKESSARQYPMLEITPRRSETDYLAEESPSMGADAWEYHLIDLTVSHTGNDTGTVSNAVLLYREAFRIMLEVDNTFGDLFNRIQLKGADYSDMLKIRDQDVFLQIMTQTIEVRV
jgi:hypothetical protein